MYDPAAGAYGCSAEPDCPDCGATQRCQKDGTCGCDGVTNIGHCENNVVVYCVADQLYFDDCSLGGYVCGTGDGGLINCLAP